MIVPGSQVRMHFTLRLDDGTEVETSTHGAPIDFEMGDGTLITGLERALYGLKTGDRQTLRISPEEGYGARDPENIYNIKRDMFENELPVEPGVVMGFELPSGEEVHGTIVSIDANDIRVDFNHPLAGREVIFEVEILDVENQTVANGEDENPTEH